MRFVVMEYVILPLSIIIGQYNYDDCMENNDDIYVINNRILCMWTALL